MVTTQKIAPFLFSKNFLHAFIHAFLHARNKKSLDLGDIFKVEYLNLSMQVLPTRLLQGLSLEQRI